MTFTLSFASECPRGSNASRRWSMLSPQSGQVVIVLTVSTDDNNSVEIIGCNPYPCLNLAGQCMSTIDKIDEQTNDEQDLGSELVESTLERLHSLERENERLREERDIARDRLESVEEDREELRYDLALVEAEVGALRRERNELIRRIVLDEDVIECVNELVEGDV